MELVQMWPSISLISDGVAVWQTLSCCIQRGAVFLCFLNDTMCAFSAIERIGDVGVVHCLPCDSGVGLGKACLKAVRAWARDFQIKELEITLTSFNGSNYRYVKHCLGFKRKSETFVLTV